MSHEAAWARAASARSSSLRPLTLTGLPERLRARRACWEAARGSCAACWGAEAFGGPRPGVSGALPLVGAGAPRVAPGGRDLELWVLPGALVVGVGAPRLVTSPGVLGADGRQVGGRAPAGLLGLLGLAELLEVRRLS